MRRRDRGYALVSLIMCALVFAALLGVTMEHLSRARASVRRADAREEARHAARGAIRWAQGDVPAGTHRREHPLGAIVVTVDAATIRADVAGRRVTWHRSTGRWEEE
jgi:type II secretory pathway pseudopilin PulG